MISVSFSGYSQGNMCIRKELFKLYYYYKLFSFRPLFLLLQPAADGFIIIPREKGIKEKLMAEDRT